IYYFNKNNWINHNSKIIAKEFKIHKVNENILNKKYENLDFLLEEIKLWWDDLENFLNRSYGYIASHNNKIVSYALGDYLVDNIHLMGVETLKDYRKNGLSQACCEAFIKNSLSNNITPRWECMSSNIASQKLVEKLGFNKSKIYNLYSFQI
ncbi:MAG: GNAT family N-acetyltransferase, partial [Thermotogota bacterium]